MSFRRAIFVLAFALSSTSAWSDVLVHWTTSTLPPAKDIGLNTVVLSWNESFSSQAKAAQSQGYRVYAEVSLNQATSAAETSPPDLEGIILSVRQSERPDLERSLSKLRSAHPKLRFLVLNPDGKPPQMRGNLVIKRGSVLEVSSPTAQPWIDTNLALIKVEQRSQPQQVPLYTFSWLGLSDSGHPQPALTADDFSLALAEAGAFHADLILELDDHLQKALSEHDPEARMLWNQVRSYANFYSRADVKPLAAAANVAVVVDNLDATDEPMNLLARHNIPFKVLLPADLTTKNFDAFDIVVVFAKPDKVTCEHLTDLAARGNTVILLEAHGAYPWQNDHPVRVNEHTVSYAVGNGRVFEVSEPVTDPEMFAQDIRRLLGKDNALISLFNGLTTIAVPYRDHSGTIKTLEFVNYAEDSLRLQVQVKGSFASIRYESPEHECCESLVPVQRDGFTEFVIPDLRIAGRVHLEAKQQREHPPT